MLWVIFKVRVFKFDTFGPLSMFFGVSDAFCWLSNIYIFDKLLNFDKSNINVMREACLYNKWRFCSNIFENLQGINEMNPLEFFFLGGGVAMMSPRIGGTHLEWGVEGRGVRALSQILSDVSLSYSLKHISTGEHSLHISCRITHLLHLYFLFSWWRHQMETCSASLAFVWGIHRWLRGIHRSPVNSPHTDSDAKLWCFLWSTPEQTVE